MCRHFHLGLERPSVVVVGRRRRRRLVSPLCRYCSYPRLAALVQIDVGGICCGMILTFSNILRIGMASQHQEDMEDWGTTLIDEDRIKNSRT